MSPTSIAARHSPAAMDFPTSGPRPCPHHDASTGRTGPSPGLLPSSWPGPLLAGPISRGWAAEPMTAQDTLRELRGFRELGSVLYVAAHPDDENTQLIAYLARGRGYRTAYLSLTRGDGGQNVIGPELFEELGVIRTQELLAARRLDGGRQFFTRAIDFGYSKNPQETLRIWDRKAVVSDIVRVIRTFRPDVIITRFSPQGGGHGHHTASAILAVEAFKLAGDPKAFPEQIGELPPWQPKRILQNGGGFGRGGGGGSGLDPDRDRRQRPGHRRAARGHRRAEPVDAQEPGLRQLRRAVAAGAARAPTRSRSWPASRRRRTSSTASTRPGPACPAAPRSRKLADEAVAKFDVKDPAASVPALLAIRKRLARARPPTPSWPRSGSSSTGRSRAASGSWSRRPSPAPRSCRARCWHCGTRRRSRRASPSAGCRCATRSPARRIGEPIDLRAGQAGHPRREADAARRHAADPALLAARRARRRHVQGRRPAADRPAREPAGVPGRAPVPGRRPDAGDRRRARAGRGRRASRPGSSP